MPVSSLSLEVSKSLVKVLLRGCGHQQEKRASTWMSNNAHSFPISTPWHQLAGGLCFPKQQAACLVITFGLIKHNYPLIAHNQ